MTICLKNAVYIPLCEQIILLRYIIITPYFTSGHQSSSCNGACTGVIRIQTQNDFCCYLTLPYLRGGWVLATPRLGHNRIGPMRIPEITVRLLEPL